MDAIKTISSGKSDDLACTFSERNQKCLDQSEPLAIILDSESFQNV